MESKDLSSCGAVAMAVLDLLIPGVVVVLECWNHCRYKVLRKSSCTVPTRAVLKLCVTAVELKRCVEL